MTLGLMLAAGAHAVVPSGVRACSPLRCGWELFLPFEGQLPANAAGVLWAPAERWSEATGTAVFTAVDALSFQCAAPGETSRTVELEAERLDDQHMLLTPTTPLVAGEHCELAAPVDCRATLVGESYLSPSVEFDIATSAPLPSSLGTLNATSAARGDVDAITIIGSCFVTEPACAVEIALELSDEAAAWRDAFVFSTIVDGEPWTYQESLGGPNTTGGSAVGRGHDQLFAWLDAAGTRSTEPGLAMGPHRVSMRATLPGTDIELETAEVTVDLSCPGSSSVEPNDVDGGDTAGHAGATPHLLDPTDGGAPFSARDEGSSSGCSITGRSIGMRRSGAGCAVLLLSVLLGGLRGRRRCRSRRSRRHRDAGVRRRPGLRRRHRDRSRHRRGLRHC